MFHVTYRDFFGKLVLLEGRTEFEDAQSEAENHVQMGHGEVKILVTLDTADANLEEAAALSRRHSLLGTAGYGCRDDGRKTKETVALR